MKDDNSLEWKLHKQMCPTTDLPSTFYGLPNIYDINMPFNAIVSSADSICYNGTKYELVVLFPMI